MSARFLVVEDDPPFAENLVEILALSGFTAEVAPTAAEARRRAADRSFDVALIDLTLPDERGQELLSDLRRAAPHLLAIVLTAQPTVASARDAIRSGASAYVLKDGDPRELETVIRRTAEQATLARALRESEKRYALLVESAPLGIAVVQEGRYVFANERFARIFGHPDASRLVGSRVDRDLGTLDRDAPEETYTKTGLSRADGTTVDLMITRARLEIAGRAAAQLIVRDVTEENRVTRDLEDARAQLEEKRRLAALGEMVAGIAHEIRNPLQGVSWGVTELRPVCKEHGEPAQEALEKIASSTREIEAIVAEVLDYARPMKLDRISIALGDLLEATREDLVQQANAAGVLLDVACDAPGAERSLDALKMKRALVNLARNAVEASGAGCRVTLRARVLQESYVLEVEDEGSGLPIELGEKIFLPFVTTKVKGTGLGLAVVRRVAEAHGGTIRLEPRERRGTVARIELPAT